MSILFKILLFFVPLILYPSTSELFEFNKMVATYALTVMIVSLWTAKMIVQRKIIFRRTILDIPLLVFLASQFLSTLLSVDPRTSFLGYYSRFHGGLVSYLSYALLYWAWVSNLDLKKNLSSLHFLLASATIVSVYGILEHFGIDKNLWVQDVQERVFSTLGQPNWLAAWLVAIIPISWVFVFKEKLNFRSRKFWLWSGLSLIFFVTLLFTKSRSGILGFGFASLIFWGLTYAFKRTRKETLKNFLVVVIPMTISVILIGTPWTAKLSAIKSPAPALEGGGTESGTIRKIVWKGAFEIWKHHPLVGTGVETFAYSFYNFRPIEHNLVSEWDFLYNKAHNEYLNFMATTGTVGILSYLTLLAFSLLAIFRSKSGFRFALLGGHASLLVTNFFGFSVVPTSILLFLFPAFALVLEKKENKDDGLILTKLDSRQKIILGVLGIVALSLLVSIVRYWYADLLFAKGKSLNDQGNAVAGRAELIKAVTISRREAIFWDELSQATSNIAVALNEAEEATKAQEFAEGAIKESDNATALSPKNVNLKRNRATLFIRLSSLDKKYLANAIGTIQEAISLAPTDAKLYYNLALTYLRAGESQKALETFEKTIGMKPNYRDARYGYALVLLNAGQRQKAIEELTYILTKIDPKDAQVRQELDELTKK